MGANDYLRFQKQHVSLKESSCEMPKTTWMSGFRGVIGMQANLVFAPENDMDVLRGSPQDASLQVYARMA